MGYLNNIRKNRTLKVRKSLSKLVNDVKELIDRELKGRETNIKKKKIEKLFSKRINASIEDMDNLKGNEITKNRPFVKNTWYNCLINFILEPIKETLGGVKDEIMSLFKINRTKDYERLTPENNICEGRKK